MSRVLTTSDGRPVSDDNPLPVKGLGNGGPTDWDDVEGKPDDFPPSLHTHSMGDIDGLTDELNSKASQSDLEDLISRVEALEEGD